MAKAKTLRKRKFLKNTLDRTTASWNGANKILQLVARANPEIIVGQLGVSHLQQMKGTF